MHAMWAHGAFLGVPFSAWMMSLLIILLTLISQRYLIRAFHRVSHAISARTTTPLDDLFFDAAEKPASGLIWLLGVMASVHVLHLPAASFPLIAPLDALARMAGIMIVVWFAWRLLEGLTVYFQARAKQTDTPLDDQLIPFVSKTLKIFLVITAILVFAQNMGYSISGLIASLGIGGIAVAMAAKDTISNIFGSMMILLDRPFTVGDWIKTDEFEGVVEEVGFRSTRIRTFDKTLVNVPNSQLANMVVENMDARSVRRIKMRIGLTYDTTPEQMQQAIAAIEQVLCEHSGVDQTYSLVKFDNFDDSALSIFLYYFSKSPVWEEYLQVRQEVNLRIMKAMDGLGLAFAFPSMSIYPVLSENGDEQVE